MSRTDYDVIIIGAGPGGSNAATTLIKAGMRVAQIDKSKFPRVKPCAGGLTMKAIKACRQNIDSMVEAAFHEVEYNIWKQEKIRFILKRPILKMVRRPDLDLFMIRNNLQCGNFSFYEGEKVEKIDFLGRTFRVHSKNLNLTSKHVIGADGAYGITNRIFQISSPLDRALAVEADINRPASLSAMSCPVYDIAAISKGYGWVLPKKDHSSVGFYTFEKKIPQIRSLLYSYIRSKGFPMSENDIKCESHYIPVGGFDIVTPRAPVYIVGDAGGFADALTGEGIYHALESGRLAAETIIQCELGSGSHDLYYKRLKKIILPDTKLTYQLSRKYFCEDIRQGFTLLNKNYVWRPLVQGSIDGLNYRQTLNHLPSYFLKSFLNARCIRG